MEFHFLAQKSSDTLACRECENVIPIFIFTPEQIENKNAYKASNAVQFMIEGLEDLNSHMNGNLNLLYGNYIDVLRSLAENDEIDAIYTNTDYTPYAKKRDANILEFCEKSNINFSTSHDICLIEPGTVLKKDKKPYKVFTPFYNECLNNHKLESVSESHEAQTKIFQKLDENKFSIDFKKTKDFYTFNEKIHIHASREKAMNIANNYNVKKYQDVRDNMSANKATTSTTSLSAYLKFGLISIREAHHIWQIKGGHKNQLNSQLFWRDFWYHIGVLFPHVMGKAFKPTFEYIPWKNDEKEFEDWCEGRTGYPIVDAAMVQMNTTGYMNNRGRQFASSFLTKLLRIDWQKGTFAQNKFNFLNTLVCEIIGHL
jgi:deoxyribodipyrimidine photo-lyase